MGHHINKWVQRLLAPGAAIGAIALLHFGFGVGKTLAIMLFALAVLMLFLTAVDPGPKAKRFVEGLRNRVH
jgi:uncharacterized iron-regulated membrane protein